MPEERRNPLEIDKLLASLDQTRRGLDEAWSELEATPAPEQPAPASAPAAYSAAAQAAPSAGSPAPEPLLPPGLLSSGPAEIPQAFLQAAAADDQRLRDQSREQGWQARRDALRKLFMRLREERRSLEEIRRDLRTWAEEIGMRFSALNRAETELIERKNRIEEDRLRREQASVEEERRRLAEDRLRLEREKVELERRKLDEDRRVPPPAAAPQVMYVPTPVPMAMPAPAAASGSAPATAPPLGSPAAGFPSSKPEPFGKKLAPAVSDSPDPPPLWGAALGKEPGG